MTRSLAPLLALSFLSAAALAQTPTPPGGTSAGGPQASPDAEVAAHLDRGASLLYQGKYDEAIAELEAALKLRPTYLKARLNLATAYFHKKDYPRSERELLRCLKLDPAYTNARFNLAITYHASGKLDEALAAYRKVLEEDPKRDAAWKNIGRIHERQGDLLRAAADYERSLAIDPDQSGAADLRRQAEGLRLKQAAADRDAAATPAAAAVAADDAGAPPPPVEPAAPVVATTETTREAPPAPREPAPAREPAELPPPPPPAATPAPAPTPSTPRAASEESPTTAAASPEPAATPAATTASIDELQPSARRKGTSAEGGAAAAAPTPSAPPSDPQILQNVLASLVKTVSPGATLLVSAPLGVEVYLRKADIREKDPFDEYGPFRANKRTRALLKLRADITDKKHFRGYTPMTVTLEEGHYQIAFRKPGDVRPWLSDGELSVQSANISLRQDDLTSDLKIYELTVSRHDPPYLVSSLFQAAGQDAGSFGKASCMGSSFTVDGVKLRSALGSYALDPDAVDAALDVLACAGKAIVDAPQGPLVIVLTARGNFEVSRGKTTDVAKATSPPAAR